jgi:putative peptidoglycan lipid II flippase
MTRILLPGPLCFCLGGLLSAVLYTRGSFLVPAITPLIYNAGTIAGAVLLRYKFGIASLAIGTMAGAFVGPFLLPLLAASKLGLRYRPALDLGNPYFRRWLRATIPLMLGVSIVTADDWFIGYFAQGDGNITLFNFAKKLAAVPIAVLGQAIGQAAMPFFSKLYNEGDWTRFRETVDRSVTRSMIAGIFAISLLEAIAFPAVRLAYQRHAFTAANAEQTAIFFSIFLLSLTFWIGQGIYSRAIYATGNTFAPMVQSTLVTLLTLPCITIFYARLESQGWRGLPTPPFSFRHSAWRCFFAGRGCFRSTAIAGWKYSVAPWHVSSPGRLRRASSHGWNQCTTTGKRRLVWCVPRRWPGWELSRFSPTFSVWTRSRVKPRACGRRFSADL